MTDYNPDEPENLHALLGATVNVYWNQYQHYWEIVDAPTDQHTEETKRLHRALDEMGGALRGAMRTLAPDSRAAETIRRALASMGRSPNEPLDVAAVMRTLHRTSIVRDCLSINLAFELADTLLPAAEARVADLVALIASRRLSPLASKYLERVTGLHLWGFEPEAVVMCRSVLEAALVARLAAIIKLDEPPPPLETLNKLAGQLKLLAGYENAKNRRGWTATPNSPLWEAERIRWSANQLLHEVPELEADGKGLPDSAGAVRSLAGLLDRLFPAAHAS